MQGIRDNLATIVAGVLVAAGFVAVTMLLGPWRTTDARRLDVLVCDADGRTQRVPLDQDARVSVSTSLGTNVVVVEGGHARMEQADCPRGDCLRQRAISRPGEQLVCLPHRLWVEVVTQDSAGVDAGGGDATASADDGGQKDVDLVAG